MRATVRHSADGCAVYTWYRANVYHDMFDRCTLYHFAVQTYVNRFAEFLGDAKADPMSEAARRIQVRFTVVWRGHFAQPVVLSCHHALLVLTGTTVPEADLFSSCRLSAENCCN